MQYEKTSKKTWNTAEKTHFNNEGNHAHQYNEVKEKL